MLRDLGLTLMKNIYCIPNEAQTHCAVCGWAKPSFIDGWPRPGRNCPRSEAIAPAVDKLGIQIRIPSAMIPMLIKWMQAGMPERASDFDARHQLVAMKCEHCSPGGSCLKLGCGMDPNKNVPCLCLYRMTTESCPDGLF